MVSMYFGPDKKPTSTTTTNQMLSFVMAALMALNGKRVALQFNMELKRFRASLSIAPVFFHSAAAEN